MYLNVISGPHTEVTLTRHCLEIWVSPKLHGKQDKIFFNSTWTQSSEPKNTKEKEKTLKGAGEERQITYFRLAVNSSAVIMEA